MNLNSSGMKCILPEGCGGKLGRVYQFIKSSNDAPDFTYINVVVHMIWQNMTPVSLREGTKRHAFRTKRAGGQESYTFINNCLVSIKFLEFPQTCLSSPPWRSGYPPSILGTESRIIDLMVSKWPEKNSKKIPGKKFKKFEIFLNQ